jgi:SAM-dependent methyltransferase
VSDSNYGVTGPLWRCTECGFLQCHELDVLPHYEAMEDPGYEETRVQRGLQMRRLLERLRARGLGGRLLDVGAGSGILVEQALDLGFEAEGLEPSRWLQARAAERRLPVRLGTLPHPELRGSYDVVTLVDVLEHVSHPVTLLREIRRVLRPNGVLALVTPDKGSLSARLMGRRWWHFRVAHIGYFDRATLRRALQRARFRPVAFARPGWYFPADYLVARVGRYLPGRPQLPIPAFLSKLTIPLNLGDSMLALAVPSEEE